jgi:hypothetical protein
MNIKSFDTFSASKYPAVQGDCLQDSDGSTSSLDFISYGDGLLIAKANDAEYRLQIGKKEWISQELRDLEIILYRDVYLPEIAHFFRPQIVFARSVEAAHLRLLQEAEQNEVDEDLFCGSEADLWMADLVYTLCDEHGVDLDVDNTNAGKASIQEICTRNLQLMDAALELTAIPTPGKEV